MSVQAVCVLFWKATVLEEMPPFPERESSILAKLKKKKGSGAVSDIEDNRKERNANANTNTNVNGNSEHISVSTHAKVGLSAVFLYFLMFSIQNSERLCGSDVSFWSSCDFQMLLKVDFVLRHNKLEFN